MNHPNLSKSDHILIERGSVKRNEEKKSGDGMHKTRASVSKASGYNPSIMGVLTNITKFVPTMVI